MLVSPYATPLDVEALFGSVAGQEAKVDWLLDHAAAKLRGPHGVPRLQERIDDGSLDAELVVAVVTEMVVRVLRNPLGIRQESRTIDDYTHNWTVDNAVSSGALYVSEDELASLAPIVSRRRVMSVPLRVYR